MDKVKIQIIILGNLPYKFNFQKIKEWKSNIFEIIGNIEHYELKSDSDGMHWEYSDELIKNELPEKSKEADFLVAISNIRLTFNWFSRRIEDNTIIFTFREIKDILLTNNIPLENIIFRMLYNYTIIYQRKNKIPSLKNEVKFTHDETRGCIFDMIGIKSDIIYSCHEPIICNECAEKIKSDKVSIDTIENIRKEIHKIRKDLYYRIVDFVRQKPIISLFLYILSSVVIEIIASLIYDFLIKNN